jgi:hypothetical protein
MTEPPQMPHAPRPKSPAASAQDFFMTLVSAGLFLYVGFVLSYSANTPDAVYNRSVAAFTWGARFIGIAILVVAGLSYARLPGVVILDLFVAGVATALCAVVGVIWIVKGDMEGVLLLLFALLNGNATRSAWARWQALRAGQRHDE